MAGINRVQCCFILLLFFSQTVPVYSYAPDNNSTQILETYKTSNADTFVQFTIAPCHKYECELAFRVIKNKKIVSTKNLDWPVNGNEHEKGLYERHFGRGDPAKLRDRLAAWGIGDVEQGQVVFIEEIKLDGVELGLLVTQVTGLASDHSKRRHYLIVYRNNKIKIIWRGIEAGAGPTWSTVVKLGQGNSETNKVLYVHSYYKKYAAPDQFDNLRVKTLLWNNKTYSITESIKPLNLHTVIWGPFKSFQKARSMQKKLELCDPKFYWVLPENKHQDIHKSQARIISFSSQKRDAIDVMQYAVKCDSNLKGFYKLLSADKINN